MKVIVSGEVIAAICSTADVWKLHRLLALACEGRHAIVVDPPTSLATWLATIDAASRTAYASAIALCARQASTLPADAATVHVVPTGASVWADPIAILTIDDALAVLTEALGVFVENSENDWHFLCAIMRPSERMRIQRAVDKGWVGPIHGGGHTLLAQVETRTNNPAKGLRTFVLFDSDRLHPDECAAGWTPDRPGKNPVACQAFRWEQVFQEKLPQRYWMLRRRFIESYMPPTELSRAASARVHEDAVEAFTRIARDGRWYFNMKEGFAGDEKRDDKERCRDLYDRVDPQDRKALKNGFGSKLAQHYGLAGTAEFNWDDDAREEAERAMPKLMRLL